MPGLTTEEQTGDRRSRRLLVQQADLTLKGGDAYLDVDLTHMADQLPPIIARDSVEQLLGGVISPKYLANLDSLGQGPERMRIGRKIAYRTSDLLTWLSKRAVQLH